MVFEKKRKKKAETIIYALSSLLAQNRKKKNLMGKLNEKKWRSKNAHDKEAHSNKIK